MSRYFPIPFDAETRYAAAQERLNFYVRKLARQYSFRTTVYTQTRDGLFLQPVPLTPSESFLLDFLKQGVCAARFDYFESLWREAPDCDRRVALSAHAKPSTAHRTFCGEGEETMQSVNTPGIAPAGESTAGAGHSPVLAKGTQKSKG